MVYVGETRNRLSISAEYCIELRLRLPHCVWVEKYYDEEPVERYHCRVCAGFESGTRD